MSAIALFHSVLGLRQVEAEAADRLRRSGHTVVVPDLYGGSTATSIDEGVAIMKSVGWETICRRAQDALDRLPPSAVLAGHSMGVGVIGSTWPGRPNCSGVIMLHGLTVIPEQVRQGVPVAVHIADPDPFALPEQIDGWIAAAEEAGASANVFLYPSVGHFYTDQALPDYDRDAADQTWERVLPFLSAIPSR